MKALIVFSGGQDSTTCLAWAKKNNMDVSCITFAYGQKHAVEVEQAKKIAEMFSVPIEVVDLPGVFSNSALLEHDKDVSASHELNSNLPASFVPGRNMVFLAIAGAKAISKKYDCVITGVCQTDFSGYPDCRKNFIEAQERAIRLATDNNTFKIHTPLMFMTKAEIWRMARELDIMDVIVNHSHTDYNGERGELHPWGYGNLDNPATKLRAEGYNQALKNGWL